ncbi:MAG: hypothetical protein EOO96_00375 [Pedobacter sp.]|nr:MAG: hypothetical protein EOO96_00375 [Pedobacter sp.]
MTTNLTKHIIIRVIVSSILLFLLHFSQIDYEIDVALSKIGIDESAIAFIGGLILFAWLIFMGTEVYKCFKIKLKWFAFANILIIVLTLIGFAFIQILLALACC